MVQWYGDGRLSLYEQLLHWNLPHTLLPCYFRELTPSVISSSLSFLQNSATHCILPCAPAISNQTIQYQRRLYEFVNQATEVNKKVTQLYPYILWTRERHFLSHVSTEYSWQGSMVSQNFSILIWTKSNLRIFSEGVETEREPCS